MLAGTCAAAAGFHSPRYQLVETLGASIDALARSSLATRPCLQPKLRVVETCLSSPKANIMHTVVSSTGPETKKARDVHDLG